jgi:MFS family permease
MMFVRGPVSFYVIRFLLGIAEAGFFPGIIFYLGEWFPSDARARAIARLMIAIPVSHVFRLFADLSAAVGAPEGGGSPIGSAHLQL